MVSETSYQMIEVLSFRDRDKNNRANVSGEK